MFMSIRDSDLEYLIDVRGIDEARVWLKYDDGYLTIGCDEHQQSRRPESEGGARDSCRCRTFLLIDHLEIADVRTECAAGGLLIRVPKSRGTCVKERE